MVEWLQPTESFVGLKAKETNKEESIAIDVQARPL